MPSSASTVTASLLPIIDAIPDPFVVVDLQHRIVYANRAAALSARRDRQGMVGRLVTDIVPFARGKALVAALASATSSPEPVVIEEYVHETDRWYETTLIVEATTRALFSRDITVKKGALELAARLARHSSVRADVSAALTDSDEGVVLQECCESLVRHLKVAFARAWVISPDDTTLLLRASAGLYTHLDGAHGAVPVGQFKIGRIAATRQAHLSNEVATDSQIGDPAWAQREGMRAFAERRTPTWASPAVRDQ